MRFGIIAVLVVALCASCSSPDHRESSLGWPKINWNWQNDVLESREAWDNATGRNNEYQGGGAQLAK